MGMQTKLPRLWGSRLIILQESYPGRLGEDQERTSHLCCRKGLVVPHPRESNRKGTSFFSQNFKETEGEKLPGREAHSRSWHSRGNGVWMGILGDLVISLVIPMQKASLGGAPFAIPVPDSFSYCPQRLIPSQAGRALWGQPGSLIPSIKRQKDWGPKRPNGLPKVTQSV